MSTETLPKLAPVALFVYNRLANTKEVVEALQQNELASKTDLFIFSDAPKSERHVKKVQDVREYISHISGFKSVQIVERKENYYIERNIIDGVTTLVNRFGKIIVLEDDGVTMPQFLKFMNDALDFYEKEKRVMHIGTFTFIQMPEGYNKTFLWRYAENTGGGWGTWKDRWEKFKWFQDEQTALNVLSEEQKIRIQLDGASQCLNLLRLKPIPWDICWNIAITRNDGLAVNSPIPFTKNNGLYNGTHFSALNRVLGKNPFEVEFRKTHNIVFEEKIEENDLAFQKLQRFYQRLGSRKRDKVLNGIVRVLVHLRVTRAVKYLLKAYDWLLRKKHTNDL